MRNRLLVLEVPMSNFLRAPASRVASIVLLLVAVTGCVGVGMGTLADILSADEIYGTGQDLRGEIRRIDTRRQEIELESKWRTERVRYDGRTEVIYRQRRYRGGDLERGDFVRIRTDTDRRGDLYASTIQVQEGGRDRRDSDRRDTRRQGR